MKNSHSQRQLYTIKTFATEDMCGETKMAIHVGCMGCGKTYGLVEAFGIYCCRLREAGIQGLNFVLLGRTQSAVKKNMCNVMSQFFGTDFKYDSSKKSGIVKDATLFGQNLYIIGFSDSKSEEKFRGLSNIMGILHDEAVFCTKEQFDLIMSRLRGEIDVDLPDGYIKNWYIGSTNPDVPTHFIKEYIDNKILKLTQWYYTDACWNGFKAYFKRQIKLYRNNPAYWDRYILGKWATGNKMVYPMFYESKHVLKDMIIDYSRMKRTFLAIDAGSDHPTGILVISVAMSGEYIISREKKLTNTAPSSIIDEIVELIRMLNNVGVVHDDIYVDPAAKWLKDEIIKRGLTYTNAMNSHNDGINCVRNMLALDKLFILDECNELKGEIFAYHFKDTTNGKDEVVKLGDDLVDAMRYGVYTDNVLKGGGKVG